ncbi:ParA family protein [Frankia sp. Cj3]|uniref:ParA family protein n=1 Tax=Frankia sp. Cj3 TaxID=2880976 RepID=UPI001EF5C750|nr:ParA family protein [Frankia sp. Cj3]
MAKKIVIAIHKGGVGKTTTAKNLAAALAVMGHRTLLVDLDEQANATKGLGLSPSVLPATLNDLFADPDRDPATVVLETDVPGLHLLPAHADLSKTEKGMTLQRTDPSQPDPSHALRAVLAPLEAEYDAIIFDTPPSLNFMTINALAAADELLIPAAASAYTEDGITRTWEAFERARNSYNPNLRRARILVTRVKRTNASGAVFEGVKQQYLDAMIDQIIPESTVVDEAEQLHQPVVLYEPGSPAAQAYNRVAEIIIHE